MAVFGFYVHHRANGLPFYVGKGTELRSRLFSRRNKFHKNIVAKDGRENITITFTPCLSEAEAFQKEIALISLYRAMGIELANATDGGEGPSNPKPEVRAKISASRKKAWQNPETRKAIMAAANNPAQRAHASAMGKSLKGKSLSPEHRANISKAQMGVSRGVGRKASLETRAKLSERQNALWNDPAHREKMKKARTGKKQSLECRQKIGAAHIKLWQQPGYRDQHQLTDEQKAKIAATMKIRWANPNYRKKVIRGIAGTGKPKSKETRAKISEKLKAYFAEKKTTKQY